MTTPSLDAYVEEKHWKYHVNQIMTACQKGEAGTYAQMELLIEKLLTSTIERTNQRAIELVEESKDNICNDVTDLCENSQEFKNRVIEEFNRILSAIATLKQEK